MNIRDQKVLSAWQFDVRTNKGQPEFVNVSSAMGGPRAIAKPPANKLDNYPPTFYLTPQDWLVQLENGVYIQMSDHTKHYLLDDGDVG